MVRGTFFSYHLEEKRKAFFFFFGLRRAPNFRLENMKESPIEEDSYRLNPMFNNLGLTY